MGQKVIGLTGNIACGKSSLAELLRARAIPVLDSDDVTAELYQDASVQEEIQGLFGSLDKKRIAQMVFGDDEGAKTKRKQLEAIIHPRIEKRFREWVEENKSAPILVNVLPLLFEAGLENRYDYIVTIICDEEQQIERLQKRNPDLSREQITKRIKSQMPQELKASKADFVIDNSAGLVELELKLEALLAKLKPKAHG